VRDKALKNMAVALERKSCWEGGVGNPMTSWETNEIKRWMKTEARQREAELSTQQPAGKTRDDCGGGEGHGDCDGDEKCLAAAAAGFGDNDYDDNCQRPCGG